MSCTSLNFRTVNPFIDVEAEVDKDGSEEEDEEEELEGIYPAVPQFATDVDICRPLHRRRSRTER